jgi:hypothetical protein
MERRRPALNKLDEIEFLVVGIASAMSEGGVSLSMPLASFVRSWEIKHKTKLSSAKAESISRSRSIEASWVPKETAMNLIDKSAEEILAVFDGEKGSFGRYGAFEDLCKKAPELAIDVIRVAVKEKKNNDFRWLAGLPGLFSEELGFDDCVSRLAQLIDLFTGLANPWPEYVASEVSRSFYVAAERATAEPDRNVEDKYLTYWLMAWERCANNGSGLLSGKFDVSLDKAINAPSGNLAEGLLKLIWCRNLVRGNSIPMSIMKKLDVIIDDCNIGGRFGRVCIAAALLNFSILEKKWTVERILPKFSWKHQEASELWDSFLFAGRWGAELMKELSFEFCTVPDHFESLGDSSRRNFVQMLCAVVIHDRTVLRQNDIHSAFRKLSPADLQNAVWMMQRWLEHTDVDASVLWNEKLGPFIEEYWPSSISHRTHQLSISLAEMALRARAAFPAAVDILLKKHLLVPGRKTGLFLYRLVRENDDAGMTDNYDVIEKHPNNLLCLLDNVFDGPEIGYAGFLEQLIQKLKIAGIQDDNVALRRLTEIAAHG